MKQVTGYELYRGPSRLDGEEIVAVLTLHSTNRKTGDMAQVWILRADQPPTEALRSGADASVCGGCPHRQGQGGMCYVQVAHAPGRVWRSWKESRYPEITGRTRRRLRGRAIRIGAYGDPAAVPYEVWQPLVRVAGLITSYTHQLSHPNFDRRLLEFCMVSADSEDQFHSLAAEGIRSFRIKAADEPALAGEITCPASTHDEVQCIDCGLCNGAAGTGPSVVIDAHGSRAKRINIKEVA